MKLIAGGLIVTMNQKREIIEDGAVAIEDNKIVDVGKHEELKKKYRTDEVMDARGKIILPGLICTHTHMPYVLGHNMPVDLSKLKSFIELLTKWAWPMLEDKITKDYIYHASLFACMRMVKSGTTCINEMVEAPFDIKGCLDYSAKAVEEIGMRANIAYEATERVSVENAKEGINENLRFAKSWNQKNESRIRGRFGVHTAFTCSPEMLKEVRELATKHNAGIHIHIAESTYEIEFLKNKYGKTSVELLHEIEFLGPDVLAAHCIHLSDNDLRLMKLNEVRVSHTPMSNMLGACGVARVPDMLDMGIVVSLGHDCFFTLDIFEYMRAAFLLHKIHRLNPLVMAPHQVLEMVTINGAKALGLESEVGSIEVGKKADIIIAKPVSPTPVNAFTLASYLVSDVNGSNVETVII
ncbi:MAG: amidohydrolase, partial [Candidatus Bathyarchaeia archaeon]